MTDQTRVDDIEMVVKILVDAPTEGISLDGIQEKTEAVNRRLSLREINMILCDLGGKVGHEKIRLKGIGKVTLFHLKLSRS